MGVEKLAEIDDTDSRRELFYLMSRLSPARRVEFLQWCAGVANGAIMLRHDPPWVLTVVQNETGEAMESYLDLMGLISQWGLDAGVAVKELERRVSREIQVVGR